MAELRDEPSYRPSRALVAVVAPPEAAQLHRLSGWTGRLAGTVTYAPPFPRLGH